VAQLRPSVDTPTVARFIEQGTLLVVRTLAVIARIVERRLP
jgi:hypothetical protein